MPKEIGGLVTFVEPEATLRKQRSRAVRAPDLKNGGRGLKSRSDRLAGVVSR